MHGAGAGVEGCAPRDQVQVTGGVAGCPPQEQVTGGLPLSAGAGAGVASCAPRDQVKLYPQGGGGIYIGASQGG